MFSGVGIKVNGSTWRKWKVKSKVDGKGESGRSVDGKCPVHKKYPDHGYTGPRFPRILRQILVRCLETQLRRSFQIRIIYFSQLVKIKINKMNGTFQFFNEIKILATVGDSRLKHFRKVSRILLSTSDNILITRWSFDHVDTGLEKSS